MQLIKKVKNSIQKVYFSLKHFVESLFFLDEYQKIGVIFLVVGFLFAAVSLYPMAKVFSGQWKVNQQVELVLYEVDPLQGSSFFNGILVLRYYAVVILLAVFAGYFLAVYLAKKHYIVSTIIDRLLVGLVVFGLIGARLFYVIFNYSAFSGDRLQILFIYQGGLSFFGMFLAGLLYLWVYCSRFKFNIFEFLDFLSPAILIGQVIGRFANFFNYESYGGPTNVYWKMFVPDSANVYDNINQKFFHPAFLYEIIPNFILLVLIMFFYRRLTKKRAGLVFGVYAIGYGIVRFFVEFFRLDALVLDLPSQLQFGIGGITIDKIFVSQLMSLILVIIGLIVIQMRQHVVYIRRSMTDLNVKKVKSTIV